MPHFLIQKQEIKDSYIELIENENLFHITKVLRAKIGEKIKFIDTDGFVYLCQIENITKNCLTAKIIRKEQSERMLPYNLCLIQSILANDAQNLAIANATQAGIKEIYPIITDNTSASKASLKDKIQKWEKIAYEKWLPNYLSLGNSKLNQ